MPMMMTAAGTIAPARVLVMGVGVAGLQAIATARASAPSSRHRCPPRHQGAGRDPGRHLRRRNGRGIKNAQTAGSYAKPRCGWIQAKQAALVGDHIKKQDIVVTTALIPGRRAPVLVREDMVKSMKPGSVIVDIAAGGRRRSARPRPVKWSKCTV